MTWNVTQHARVDVADDDFIERLQSLKKALGSVFVTLGLIIGTPAYAEVDVLHTYTVSRGHEVDNLIAVNASKLKRFLPAGYTLVPASELGVGNANQGIVTIVNFEGLDPAVDDRPPAAENRAAIDVAILVTEPSQAAEAGVAFPGAFHFYTLAMYSNDAPYVASLRRTDMPITFDPKLIYQRTIDDVSGVGDLVVNVSAPRSSFKTVSNALGFGTQQGPLHAIFWYDGQQGKTALHFEVPVFRQGDASGQVFMQPGSTLAFLLEGGGTGPCPPDPETGYLCVNAPSISFSFDAGDTGRLLLFR